MSGEGRCHDAREGDLRSGTRDAATANMRMRRICRVLEHIELAKKGYKNCTVCGMGLGAVKKVLKVVQKSLGDTQRR